jgi:hypothetical protein
MFDLPLALVARGIEYVDVILLSQVWGQQTHSRKVHGSASEHVQNHRVPARDASGLDPPVGGVLRQMEDARAVGEER